MEVGRGGNSLVIDKSVSDSKLINVNISNLQNKMDFFIKGSESFVSNSEFLAEKTIIKERKPKKYRDINLDSELRIQRIKTESKMIKTCLNYNILTPTLFNVDLLSFSLEMEKIDGKNLAKLLSNEILNPEFENNLILLKKFGEIVGKLHNIEIIHGDLTPTNILVTNTKKMYVIDFGLSYFSNEIKDKAMDLFILFGSFKIYLQEKTEFFSMFLEGYKISSDYEKVMIQFDKLTNKGRYK